MSVFFSGYALLNTSRTAANDFDAKQCWRMDTLSAREYTMFAPAQLLRLREQRLSNQGDLDWNVSEVVGRVYYRGGGSAFDFIFVPYCVIFLGCGLNGTLCTHE
jgi:hypothetical protein